MWKGCTKFRLFNLLIVLGVINFLVFRSYFSGSASLPIAHVYHDVTANATSSRDGNLATVKAKAVVNTNSNPSTSNTDAKPKNNAIANSTTSLSSSASSSSSSAAAATAAAAAAATRSNTPSVNSHNSSSSSSSSSISSNKNSNKSSNSSSGGDVDSSIAKFNGTRGGDVDSSIAKFNGTRGGVGVGGGEGRRSLEAWGKRVTPGAEVIAPWTPENASSSSSTPLPLCPLVPPKLVGALATYSQAPNWTEIVRLNPGLEPGGHYQPADCRARNRVAVVIPYRDREEHLRILLNNLHPMLMRQQLDYFVLVVELALPTKFNRGLLLNIGAVEALGLRDVQCFVFHDVDLVPENDKNLYTCPSTSPRHMSAAVDKFKYKSEQDDNSFLTGAMQSKRDLCVGHQSGSPSLTTTTTTNKNNNNNNDHKNSDNNSKNVIRSFDRTVVWC